MEEKQLLRNKNYSKMRITIHAWTEDKLNEIVRLIVSQYKDSLVSEVIQNSRPPFEGGVRCYISIWNFENEVADE
jgi:hypothetical protein